MVQPYFVGDWPAPFGIVLVLDRLAALMLAIAAVIALAALAAAVAGERPWDARGRFFHPLFQFQLMGLNGAFLTGDLFNLFVFFEVLLVASYCLLLHGQGDARLRAGLHYVVVNLAASALFLVGVALLYSITGTLNLADLALRVPRVPPPDAPLVRAAALLLLVVFGVKAAAFPLYLWLPRAYAAAAAPVAALFALMTKVGVYSIVRVHGVVFGPDAGEAALVAAPWLAPAALATALLGVVGALAAPTLGRMAAYLTVASVGTLLIAVGAFSTARSGRRALLSAALVAGRGRRCSWSWARSACGAARSATVSSRAPRSSSPALLGALFVLRRRRADRLAAARRVRRQGHDPAQHRARCRARR